MGQQRGLALVEEGRRLVELDLVIFDQRRLHAGDVRLELAVDLVAQGLPALLRLLGGEVLLLRDGLELVFELTPNGLQLVEPGVEHRLVELAQAAGVVVQLLLEGTDDDSDLVLAVIAVVGDLVLELSDLRVDAANFALDDIQRREVHQANDIGFEARQVGQLDPHHAILAQCLGVVARAELLGPAMALDGDARSGDALFNEHVLDRRGPTLGESLVVVVAIDHVGPLVGVAMGHQLEGLALEATIELRHELAQRGPSGFRIAQQVLAGLEKRVGRERACDLAFLRHQVLRRRNAISSGTVVGLQPVVARGVGLREGHRVAGLGIGAVGELVIPDVVDLGLAGGCREVLLDQRLERGIGAHRHQFALVGLAELELPRRALIAQIKKEPLETEQVRFARVRVRRDVDDHRLVALGLLAQVGSRGLEPQLVALLEAVQEGLEALPDLIDGAVLHVVEDLHADAHGGLNRVLDGGPGLLHEGLDGVAGLLDGALDARLRVVVEGHEALLGAVRGVLDDVDDALDQPLDVALDLVRHVHEAVLEVVDQRLDGVLRAVGEGLTGGLDLLDGRLDAGLARVDVVLALAVDQVVDQITDGLELTDERLTLADEVHHDGWPERQRQLDDLEDRRLGHAQQDLALGLELGNVGIDLGLKLLFELLGRLLHLRLDLLDRLRALLADLRDLGGVLLVPVVDEVLLRLGEGLIAHLLDLAGLLLRLLQHAILGLVDLEIQIVAQVFHCERDALVDLAEADVDGLAAGAEHLVGGAAHLVERVLREGAHQLDEVVDRLHQAVAGVADEREAFVDDGLDVVGDEVAGVGEPLAQIGHEGVGDHAGLRQALVDGAVDLGDDAVDRGLDLLGQRLQGREHLGERGVDRVDGLLLGVEHRGLGRIDDPAHRLDGAVLELVEGLVELHLDLAGDLELAEADLDGLFELGLELGDDLVEALGHLFGELVHLRHEAIELLVGGLEQLLFHLIDGALHRLHLGDGGVGHGGHLRLRGVDDGVLHGLELVVHSAGDGLDHPEHRLNPRVGHFAEDGGEGQQRRLDGLDGRVDAPDHLGPGRVDLVHELIEAALDLVDDRVGLLFELGELQIGLCSGLVDRLFRLASKLRGQALRDLVFGGVGCSSVHRAAPGIKLQTSTMPMGSPRHDLARSRGRGESMAGAQTDAPTRIDSPGRTVAHRSGPYTTPLLAPG